MGYNISTLNNLPAMAGYYFLLLGRDDYTYGMSGTTLYHKFDEFADRIGKNSAIVKTKKPDVIRDEIIEVLKRKKWFHEAYISLLHYEPALVVMKPHPEYFDFQEGSIFAVVPFKAIDCVYNSELDLIDDVVLLATRGDMSLFYKVKHEDKVGLLIQSNGGLRVDSFTNLLGNEELFNRGENMGAKKVFIVHGHEDNQLLRVKDFIRDLGLEPIILKEKASSGMTIIDKFESYSDVAFGVVLYTASDIGKAKDDKDYRLRARQNVVFEHGYLLNKLGRNKVVALVEDKVETPGDLSGVVYISFTNSNDWKIEIVKEMNAAGMNLIIK